MGTISAVDAVDDLVSNMSFVILSFYVIYCFARSVDFILTVVYLLGRQASVYIAPFYEKNIKLSLRYLMFLLDDEVAVVANLVSKVYFFSFYFMPWSVLNVLLIS